MNSQFASKTSSISDLGKTSFLVCKFRGWWSPQNLPLPSFLIRSVTMHVYSLTYWASFYLEKPLHEFVYLFQTPSNVTNYLVLFDKEEILGCNEMFPYYGTTKFTFIPCKNIKAKFSNNHHSSLVCCGSNIVSILILLMTSCQCLATSHFILFPC